MKQRKKIFSSISGIVRQSARAGLLLIVVAAITLEATGFIQYYFSKKGIQREAILRAEGQLETVRVRIQDIVNQTEAAVRNNVRIARFCLAMPDTLPGVPYCVVEDNPVVVGSTIAMVPGYYPTRPLYSPYVCREGDSLAVKSLATEEYDYPAQEWFTGPLSNEDGYWSEPYIDEGGGDILMTTFSLPVRDAQGRVAAVLTADVSLDWLSHLVSGMQVYSGAYGLIHSRAGTRMIGPEEEMPADEKVQVYRAREDRTGWEIAIVIPEEELFGGIRRVGLVVKLLQLLGIAMLILILRSVAKNQIKYHQISEKKERMERELQIGRNIQMSMIPHISPPFPERTDLDMASSLTPAKEVGGDLFDFYIRDEKLYFCIGDVSGKGVPASLVMAVTRSLFRMVSAHERSPRRIITAMNESMSDMNESDMFVTFFCGVLDMATGHLRYCNAGHNAPMILTDRIEPLACVPNLPLGILAGMSFQEQETDLKYDDALFLFTDGVTEAENAAHELFGDDRMKAVLSTRRSAQGHLEAMQQAVATFVDGAEQSDDLTMLFIHYLNQSTPDVAERHLMLRNDIKQIPQLAGFVEAIAAERQLDHTLMMSLNLALEEAVANVVLYAYPDSEDGLVDVEAVVGEGRLTFILTDSGKPFDPTRAPEVDVAAGVEKRRIGGLGIHMVRSIMDEVRYERVEGKNVLTLVKKI